MNNKKINNIEGSINLEDKIAPAYINTKNPKWVEVDNLYYSGLIIVNYNREYQDIILKNLIENNINLNISIFYEKQDKYKIIRDLTYHIGTVGADLKDIKENNQEIDVASFAYQDAKYIRTELQVNNEEIYFLYIYVTTFSNDIKELERNENLKEQLKDTNYIIVSTGDEENNIKIAKNLRRIFLEISSVEPEIFIWMEESIKKEKIKNINNYFVFKTFGDYQEIYGAIQKNSKLEKLAIKLHLTYNGKDKDLKEYNKIEYNKKSSRAMALHFMYKLYPYIERDENGNIKDGEINRILQNETILNELAQNEHNRWLTYLRTEGYKYETKEIAKKYFEKVGTLREHFLKMHPALVGWNKLDEVKKVISEIENKPEKDMKQNTKESIIKMLESMGEEIKNV